MKILMLHNHYQIPGGEDLSFATEVALLKENDHDVVTYVRDNDDINSMSRAKVAADTIWSRDSYREITNLLRKERPDIVHCQNIFPLISPAVYYAAKEQQIPVIQSLRNYRMMCANALFLRDGHVCEACLHKRFAWPAIVHKCYRENRLATSVVALMNTIHQFRGTWTRTVDGYIALTEFVKSKYVERGLPADKIYVKPNSLARDPGISGDQSDHNRYVVFAARLSPEKGIMTLLEAWRQLPQIPLKVLGAGPMLETIRTYIAEHGLDQVQLMGHQDAAETLRLIQGSRLLIFPSECYETFGRTIVEAYACGIPVVASRLGAMQEVVDHEHTGLLFQPGNAVDLATQVRRLWDDDELQRRLAKAARTEYLTKYTPERNYQALMEIYRTFVN